MAPLYIQWGSSQSHTLRPPPPATARHVYAAQPHVEVYPARWGSHTGSHGLTRLTAHLTSQQGVHCAMMCCGWWGADVMVAGGRVRAVPSSWLSEGCISNGTLRANGCGWARGHETVWVLRHARVDTGYRARVGTALIQIFGRDADDGSRGSRICAADIPGRE